MRRHRFPILLLLLLMVAAGCDSGSADGGPPGAAAPTTTAAQSPGGPGESDTPPNTAPAEPSSGPDGPSPPVSSRTAYAWGVPSEPVRISHRVPIASPPAPPLPYLVKIAAADHPEGEPRYSRISFTFRGGFPPYHLEYTAAVRGEGTGEAIRLPGNAFLRVRFVQAQAHDERGISTVAESPRAELGYRTLLGYGFAGDFEGYLTYGLGIQVPPASDHAIPVRAVEVARSDGTFVVAIDVQHG